MPDSPRELQSLPFASRALVAALRIYQIALSPLFGRACRFEPTCSAYAVQSIRIHGAWFGLWYALRRLARCHPFCAGGFDPVPPARVSEQNKTESH
ncbi:MAG: membrane protein insertion efficiency factor YidD [Deltaproteobacteria bacterium]|nr:membrane protein insertion efficiency factor YidD [Deltaproteobacteria bacterium]